MLIDSHCHLDFPVLAENMDDVLARARNAGIERIVTISTKVREFDKIRAIADAHDDVYCSVGTHPHHADLETDIGVDDIVSLTDHAKVVAIGEAGLDYHYDNGSPQNQAAGFRTHIAAARETGLPLVIHSRSADDDTARILEEEMAKEPFTAVLHCFTAGRDLAERGLALGLYISFSGVLTFKKSEELRAIARDVPLDRLLVETDAPYLAPEPKRGRPNEPSYVAHTAERLADVKGLSAAELGEATTENFYRLFSKVPRPERAIGSGAA